jgi:predicted kinase
MRQTRGRWLDLFADYNARIEVVYLEPPFKKLLRQNMARSKAVPEPVIRKLAEKCEPPTWIECHSLVISDGGSE